MPELIINGPAGRLEARYHHEPDPQSPTALILHPHPQFGGTMNNPLVYDLFHMFHGLGCTTVRFNFRGVGRSQGSFDNGAGELGRGVGHHRAQGLSIAQVQMPVIWPGDGERGVDNGEVAVSR